MTTNPPAIVKRHSRAIRILSCLQSGPSFNARELARRLNVSRRTIYRDLSLIRDAGIPVKFDGEHSAYRLEPHHHAVAPVQLEPEDLTRLALTSHLSLLHGLSADFEVSVRESMARLLQPYPNEIRGPIQRILSCCRVRQTPQASAHASRILQTILVGVGRGRQVRLEVNQQDGQGIFITRLATYRVEVEGGRWAVSGRSSQHRRNRTFQQQHILSVATTNEPYSIPQGSRSRKAS